MPYLEVVVSKRQGEGDVLFLTGNDGLVRRMSRVIAVIRDVVDCDIIQDHPENIGPYS